MSITDGLRKVFDDCTVMAGVEADFECVYIAKAAALKLLDEIDEAFAEGHARAVEYGKALNAETCVMEYGGDVAEVTARVMGVYFCSECGSPNYNDCMPHYCIYCGKAVKR